MLKTYPRILNVHLSKHFSSHEFDCKCDSLCETKIDDRLVVLLQALRDLLGRPIKITSGYRCPFYQEELRRRGFETAAGVSSHELGQAVDLMVEGMTGAELEKLARKAGFKAVGVGHSWIHVDIRADKVRSWSYVKR